jgi:signal transduction histidine kinase
VAPDLVPTLFQRYAPADHRGQHGAGFGLYIVERLAEANDGTVAYRFTPPSGSRFTITLPAATGPRTGR